MKHTTPVPSSYPKETASPASPGVPRPVHDAGTTVRRRPVPGPRDVLRPGDRIGRYLVQSTLGRGGMGVVYGAIDPELERRVAIKLVRARDEDHARRFTTRLRREAQALARVVHPNIVALYDVGTARQGAFMSMEYLRGQNLKRWLASEDRRWTEILAVFVEAGQGIAAAHAAGLVHRDFKPTNVMLCNDGRVKVLDFGLAFGTPTLDPWLTTTNNGGNASLLSRKLTRHNVVLGTVGYMSPEALLSDDPVGPRSDQFSFCVALFEALYGARPYPGRDPVEMAAAFANGRMRPPIRRAGVPRRIERAILRGLSLDPVERFMHMDMLLDELRWRPRRRWRALATAGAIVSTACLSAATTMMIGRWVTPPPTAMCTPAGDGDPLARAQPHP